MKLSVEERFRLLELLGGEQGNIATIGVINKIVNTVEFTVEELELYGIVIDGQKGRVTWKRGPDIPVEADICLSQKQINFIANIFRRSTTLNASVIPLLKKFGIDVSEEPEE